MRAVKIAGAALAVTMAFSTPALADGALDRLIENARAWEARGREDKAREAWEKVLRSAPENADALQVLGLHAARAGDGATARRHLERLRQTHPGHPGIAQIEQALQVGDKAEDLLGQARRKARAGDPAGAVAIYRQLFGGGEPPRALALEFYQTLGGTEGGWAEARAGLERLVAGAPGVSRLRLALARHLTYRESARREGIRMLESLASDPRVASEAQGAWRQALLWLETGPGDAALLQRYVDRHPLDAEVKNRIAAARSVGAGATLGAGYRALDRADVKEAERIFRTAGRGAEALVGQALVAMKEEEFGKAKALLEQVKALEPNKPALWERSLQSASFWALVKEAEGARKAKRYDEAATLLDQALSLHAEEAPQAELSYGWLEFERERYPEAERRFRTALEAMPDQPDALRGLVNVLLRSERTAEAAALNGRLAEVSPEKAYAASWIAAERLRAEAAELRRSKDFEGARTRLLAARDADRTNPWTLHDLANLQLEAGDLTGARSTLDELIALAPEMREIRLIQTRLLAAEGSWSAALDLLENLPESAMDGEMLRWKKELQLRGEVERILAMGRADSSAARLELQRLQWKVQGDSESQLIIAGAWARLGDGERAAMAAGDLLARSRTAPARTRLQLAAILLEADREPELVALLRELAVDTSLTRSELRDLEALRVGYGVRIADKLREQGAFDRAFSHLSPLVQEFPDNSALLCAVGRLYRSAGDDRQAHAVFLRVLRRDPDHFEARKAAIESAISLQIYDEAEKLTDEGLLRTPNDPNIHLVAGRVSVAKGDPGEGMERFRRAEVLASSTSATSLRTMPAAGGVTLTDQSSTADILRAGAVRFSGGGQAPVPSGGGEDALLSEIQREIDSLRTRLGIRMGGGGEVRFRDGEGGLGALTALRVPLHLEVPLGYEGVLGFHLAQVALSSGALGPGDPATRFGLGAGGPDDDQTASGTEVSLAFTHGGLKVDVGSTPLGFPLQTVVGGLEWRWEGDGIGLRAELSRRSVDDSLLSWGGLTSGEKTWGGVIRQGAQIDLAFRTGETLFYLLGGFQLVQGKGVADNRMASAGVGTEWSIYDLDGAKVSTGLAITGLGYEKNLRYFTVGHGGYFSPQAFARLGVPLKWTGGVRSVRWEVLADPGINWFREEEAPRFPLDPELGGEPYAGQTNVSFSLNAQPRLSWLVSDFMSAGVTADLHTADDYQEVGAAVFLEGTFEGRRR